MKYLKNIKIAWTYMKKKSKPTVPTKTLMVYDTSTNNIVYDTVYEKLISAKVSV